MKLSVIFEADFKMRQLERLAKAGDVDARTQLIGGAISGRFGNDPPEGVYQDQTIEGKPLSDKTPSDVNPEWGARHILVVPDFGIKEAEVSPWEALGLIKKHDDGQASVGLTFTLYAEGMGDGGHWDLGEITFHNGDFYRYDRGYRDPAPEEVENRMDNIEEQLDDLEGFPVAPMSDWWVNFLQSY